MSANPESSPNRFDRITMPIGGALITKLNDDEREEFDKLKAEVALLRGFINYHWGEPFRKWKEAIDRAAIKRPFVSVPVETIRDAYIDSEG